MLTLISIPLLLGLTGLAGAGWSVLLGLDSRIDPGPSHSGPVRKASALAYCFTLGCAMSSLAFAALGHLSLHPLLLTAITVIPACFAGRALRRFPLSSPRQCIAELNKFERMVLFGILCTAVLGLLGVLTPEVRHDPLFYHLEIPRLWLNFGRMVEIPENGHSYFPYGFEMMYTWALSVADDSGAKAFHWAAGLTAAAWVARLTSTFRATPVSAAGLFYFIPTMTYLSTTTYIDLATAMYGIAAIALLWEGTDQSPDRRFLMLVGLLTGSAMATKYTAWPLVGIPLGLAVLWRRPKIADLLLCGLVTLLPLCPWVLRNLVYVGNPLAPLMIGKFGPAYALGGELAGYFDSFAGQSNGTLALLSAPLVYANHLLHQKYTLPLLGFLAAAALIALQGRGDSGPRFRNPVYALIALFILLFLAETYFTRGHPDGRYGLVGMGVGASLVAMLCSRLAIRSGTASACFLAPTLAIAMFASSLFDYAHFQQNLGEKWWPRLNTGSRLEYMIGKGIVPPDYAELEELLIDSDAGRVTGIAYPSHTGYFLPIVPMRNEPVERAGGQNAPTDAIARTLLDLGFTHFVDGTNPGFDEAHWQEFLETLSQVTLGGGTRIFFLKKAETHS